MSHTGRTPDSDKQVREYWEEQRRRERRDWTALSGDVLQFIWKQYPAVCLCDPNFQERLSVHSQHGAVSLNTMSVIVSEQAHCDLQLSAVITQTKDEDLRLDTQVC